MQKYFGPIKPKRSRYPGWQERDQALNDKLDTSSIQQMIDRLDPSLKYMQSEGYTFRNADWEETVHYEAKKYSELEGKITRAHQELATLSEEITLSEKEGKELIAAIVQIEAYTSEWEIETETLDDTNRREYAEEIKQMIKKDPSLAALVLEDGTVHDMVRQGIDEVKQQAEALKAEFYEIEDRLREHAVVQIDRLNLPERFNQALAEVKELMTTTNGLRTRANQEICDLQLQLSDAEDEICALNLQMGDAQRCLLDVEAHCSILEEGQTVLMQRLQDTEEENRSLHLQLSNIEYRCTEYQSSAFQHQSPVVRATKGQNNLLVQHQRHELLLHGMQQGLEGQQAVVGDGYLKLRQSHHAGLNDSFDAPMTHSFDALMVSSRQLCNMYAENLGRPPIDSDLFERLLTVHCRLAQDQQAFQTTIDNTSPQIMFGPDGQRLSQLAHAVNLWIDAQADHPSFDNAQALFNARVAEGDMAAVCSWVAQALDANLDATASWDNSFLGFSRQLSLLQGVLYLHTLTRQLAFPPDGVERLCNKLRDHLESQNSADLFISMIFRRVAASIIGPPLASWIDSNPGSEEEAARRLAIGNGCLIACPATDSFVLIDQSSDHETLFLLPVDEIEAVVAVEGARVLQLTEGFVARHVSQSLVLARFDDPCPAFYLWASRFLSGKLGHTREP